MGCEIAGIYIQPKKESIEKMLHEKQLEWPLNVSERGHSRLMQVEKSKI